jgi:hypothetical protein
MNREYDTGLQNLNGESIFVHCSDAHSMPGVWPAVEANPFVAGWLVAAPNDAAGGVGGVVGTAGDRGLARRQFTTCCL